MSHALVVNQNTTNALIIQCIGTQYSPTCFGNLTFKSRMTYIYIRHAVNPLKIKIPSKNMRENPTNTPIINSVY